MILNILFRIATLIVAFMAWKLVGKFKIPAILGWLIAAAAVINGIIAVIAAKKGFEPQEKYRGEEA